MKRSWILILLALLNSHAIGQALENNLKAILDSVIQRTERTSMYSNSINWDSCAILIHKKAETARNVFELKPALEFLLNEIRDHHGRIIKLPEYSIIAQFTDFANSRKVDNREKKIEIWETVNDTSSRFQYALLPNKIGYLKIVGIGPAVEKQKEAERIRNAIISLSKRKVNKWIIDLRYNGGGDVNVMLAGIAPLVGEGKIASVVNYNRETIGTAKNENGNFWYYNYQAVKMKNTPIIKAEPKVAVLMSRWTVSSGELVAVSLKGRKNTKFFGETTGGYTTNTGWDIVNNEIVLVISTGIFCDRNGNIYENNIQPDIEVPFDIENDVKKDKGIIEATKWLVEK